MHENPDIYEFLFTFRKDVTDKLKDPSDEVYLPRFIKGEEFFVGEEDDMDAWFAPIILTKEFYETLSDREVVAYIRHRDMTVQ